MNIDADHLDFFKDLDDIRHSFHRFAKLLPKDGVLIINSDIEKLDAITNDLDCRIITFGLENPADYEAKDITFGEDGCGSFELVRFGKETGIRVRLSVIGRHNVANALSAIATAEYYVFLWRRSKRDSSPSTARNVVSNKKDRSTESPWSMIMHIILRRSKQRCRLLPSSHISVFGAYSNHIHTAAPRALLHEFAEALSLADNVVLADIYAAREADPGDISSKTLQEEMKKLGKDAYYFPVLNRSKNFYWKIVSTVTC